MSKKKIIIGVIVFLIIASFIGSAGNNTNPAEKTTPMPTIQTKAIVSVKPTAVPPIKENLQYQILSENKNGTTNRVEVYTTEKENEKLISLNDMLFAKYKIGLTHLYIDYFDDKAAAENYFQKQLSDSVSESEKDRLYTHYVANMVYNTVSGLKRLVRQDENQRTLKNY